ncbi:MAG: hypothetical protein ACREQV_25630 [Candidatus Binatia bacterium]
MQVTHSPMGGAGLKRLAALVSLIAVFFLPLHFHSLTATAKVAKECACSQGTRTTLSLADPPPSIVPVLEFQSVAFTAGQKYDRLSVSITSIRAPPALA